MSRPRLRIPRIRAVEVPTLVTAVVIAAAVEVGLRITTLPRLARALGSPLALGDLAPCVGRGDAVALPEPAVRRMDAARRVLRHWPFGDTCLRQALVCGRLLRHLRPELQVGVAKVDGEVRAHAWLVVNGAVVDPRRAVSSYQPLTAVRTAVGR